MQTRSKSLNKIHQRLQKQTQMRRTKGLHPFHTKMKLKKANYHLTDAVLHKLIERKMIANIAVHSKYQNPENKEKDLKSLVIQKNSLKRSVFQRKTMYKNLEEQIKEEIKQELRQHIRHESQTQGEVSYEGQKQKQYSSLKVLLKNQLSQTIVKQLQETEPKSPKKPTIKSTNRSAHKCGSCLKRQFNDTKDLFNKKQSHDLLKDKNHEKTEQSQSQLALDKKTDDNFLRTIIDSSKNPFSFTTLKWKSRKQNSVDKWKQKYGGSLEKKSKTVKILVDSPDIQSKMSLPVLPNFINENKKSEDKKEVSPKTDNKKIKKISKDKPTEKKSISIKIIKPYLQLETIKKKQNEKHDIVIKKMYDDHHIYRQKMTDNEFLSYLNSDMTPAIVIQDTNQTEVSVQSQTAKSKQSKFQKKKKSSKNMFPSVSGQTIVANKIDLSEQKRRKQIIKQQYNKPWQVKPSIKGKQKILQAVPERWQFGQSRQDSRGDLFRFYKQSQIEQQQLNQPQEVLYDAAIDEKIQEKGQQQKKIIQL